MESLLTFSLICWFGGLSVKDKKCLNDMTGLCSKVTGMHLEDLGSLWRIRVVQKAGRVSSDPNHIRCSDFQIRAVVLYTSEENKPLCKFPLTRLQ